MDPYAFLRKENTVTIRLVRPFAHRSIKIAHLIVYDRIYVLADVAISDDINLWENIQRLYRHEITGDVPRTSYLVSSLAHI